MQIRTIVSLLCRKRKFDRSKNIQAAQFKDKSPAHNPITRLNPVWE
ncbi:MAG: hypothetical protein F6K28_52955 [Microcoleus sp. SIO2G3]|nr:hypothetical protein [Microcoleus sp. SIO2G3]